MPHFSNVMHTNNFGLGVFKIVVAVMIQSVFRLEIHQNNFLFFKKYF
jgi:hypothetical protein